MDRDNSTKAERNPVAHLEKMFPGIPFMDGVNITCMVDTMVDKVRFNKVIVYFFDNARMRKRPQTSDMRTEL